MNLFGLLSTITLYLIFKKLNLKINLMLSVGLSLIIILKVFNINYETYLISANFLSFLIAPATVALAYPMYKNKKVLLKNKRALYPTLVLGAITAIISTYFCAKFFGADLKVIMSLIPKSTTMPIALEISKALGGYQELTACVVALTGIFGGVLGHKILTLLKIKTDTAIGLALGSASHVIGTAACVAKKREKQVAASTIALILVGLMTVIIISIAKWAV